MSKYTDFQKMRFRTLRQSLKIQEKGICGLFAEAVCEWEQSKRVRK